MTTSPFLDSPARLAVDHAVTGSLASPDPAGQAGVDGVKASPPGGETSSVPARPARSSAHVLATKKWRVRRARNGGEPLSTDAAPWRKALHHLLASGYTPLDVSKACDISPNTLDWIIRRSPKTVNVRTVAKLSVGLPILAERRLIQAKASLKAVEAVVGPLERDLRTWPTGAVLAAVKARYGAVSGSPLSEPDRRMLYRYKALRTARADSICLSVDLHPEDVFGQEWWGFTTGEEAC